MSTSSSPATVPSPSLDAVKARQRVMWASGSYGQIGTRLQIVGETLCEAADVRSGEHVLDVAAGNGNASLAAARRFAHVVSTDYVPELLEQGRARAAADGLDVAFLEADAERLPFADASFDVVVSTFGVMFAPDQARAAAELLRVVRPGGRIALASWTPQGFVGELLRTVSKHVAPPAGVRPPTLWGTEPFVVEHFGPKALELRSARRSYAFRFASATHWIDCFRTWYGPTLKAYEVLPPDGRERLTHDLGELLGRHDVGAGRGLVVPSEYLETIISL
ncbi:MAG: class I SAM-dependent methyltransferase [Planctomycetota bacterium]